MFFAYEVRNGCRWFFSWYGCDEWATREELDAAIEQWKKRVTPQLVAVTTFDIRFAK